MNRLNILMEEVEGRSCDELFKTPGLSYEDFTLLPVPCSDVDWDKVKLGCQLSRSISLKLPLASAPLNAVADSEVAIGMSLSGGIGIIHRNGSPEVQAAEVVKVKRFKHGINTEPKTLSPNHKVSDVIAIREEEGYCGVPITDTGKIGGKLLGIVTLRDIEPFLENESALTTSISQVMTTEVITASIGIPVSETFDLLRKKKVGKLPLVDDDSKLRAMVLRSDIKKIKEYPNASEDGYCRLLVGAAVGTDLNTEKDRVDILDSAGVDVLYIESKHGGSEAQLDLLRYIKTNYPRIQAIASNVLVVKQAEKLINAGADCICVGLGDRHSPASQEVMGVGRAQATALFKVSKYAKDRKIPVMAYGGMRTPAEIMKALAIGASTVMISSMLAKPVGIPFWRPSNGIEEQAGKYVGLPSQCRSSSYSPFGPGSFSDTGITPLKIFLRYLEESMKRTCQALGVDTLPRLRQEVDGEYIRFEGLTAAAQGKIYTGRTTGRGTSLS